MATFCPAERWTGPHMGGFAMSDHPVVSVCIANCSCSCQCRLLRET